MNYCENFRGSGEYRPTEKSGDAGPISEVLKIRNRAKFHWPTEVEGEPTMRAVIKIRVHKS